MPETVLVVPCYNEACRLDVRHYRDFVRGRQDVAVLLVNDGSTDRTLSVLDSLRSDAPDRFIVHDLPRNVGKAEAVRRGLCEAFRLGPAYVGYWDADLATPLEAYRQFRQVLEVRPQCRLVMGSRVKLLGRRIERRWVRHLFGRAFATAASFVLGLGVYDTQCGAKLFRATPQVQDIFQQPFQSRWIFDVEILARMISSEPGGGRQHLAQIVYELPLDEWRDVAGSKLKTRDFAAAAWELARIYRRYMWAGNSRTAGRRSDSQAQRAAAAGPATAAATSAAQNSGAMPALDDHHRRAA